MKMVYLDNASTTALRPEVTEEITRILSQTYGNPSSTHSFGRSAKVVLEASRKAIASMINAEAREIIFTSGGTEANNWVLYNAVKKLKVKRIISSRIEHHSVLNTIAETKSQGIEVVYVNLLPGGYIDIGHLEELLADTTPTLVSLMHVNNETGTVLNLNVVGGLCKKYNAYFHSDTVQSVGKFVLDVKQLPVDFLVASAHKFHGPKGVGFLYIKKGLSAGAMLLGGEQEKGLRAGTEAVHQVGGMATALTVSYKNLTQEQGYITEIKKYLLEQLNIHFPGYKVNGEIYGREDEVFYNIANIQLPLVKEKTQMILFHLDMKGVAISRGSACQSGSIKPSHVLKEILPENEVKKPSLRISFSHYNTKEDIDLLIAALKTV
ncbi:cysteine desulfurase family protein [Flavobacterium rhizosphaerae]|uniref:cysteine desulfurase n=1 Tax=Flavobacterium rhizosphaerae TaxID=3163298 RepID=A0ABW8YW68_9FLAO